MRAILGEQGDTIYATISLGLMPIISPCDIYAHSTKANIVPACCAAFGVCIYTYYIQAFTRYSFVVSETAVGTEPHESKNVSIQ